ncbi:hypothetical protein PHYBLDRAFT_150335 [Phycomyces blakesleeanus NRRL 1555(-)]|uniref:Uncharacterized protein n=1 Tax=Phycomyces blakesleeanus (strain ATCC 8743b / DSM 1359 / FGSC 10004 / NBRC 33097 / NRRL 1555) TaxID=763407 RepID=A0A162NE77_PHYB8|nr:hypothetical protein PHYBLDRAFT_150335 [Phycomyces blakesleeanus NRRL 1555(-)]OAD68744.1 hypothetical protein PHYBLDRAFT_150335 [Phycomyces blakesleeanus NRRL 1555(-)]|eukprot:XP_018286784.1 hypothetical protein PHYBLDRAFT_150335 [Phycomyces blakesleeanus NRRL 1555(-)]
MSPRSTPLSIYTPSCASLSQLSDKPSLKSPAPLVQELSSSRLKKTLFKKTLTNSFAIWIPSPHTGSISDEFDLYKLCYKEDIFLSLLKEIFDKVKKSNKTLKSMLQALIDKDTVGPTSLMASKHAPKNITNSSNNNNNNKNNNNNNNNKKTKTTILTIAATVPKVLKQKLGVVVVEVEKVFKRKN